MPALGAVCGHAATRMVPQGRYNSAGTHKSYNIIHGGCPHRSWCGPSSRDDGVALGRRIGTRSKQRRGRGYGIRIRAMALLDPPDFNPQKLKVVRLSEEGVHQGGEFVVETNAGSARRYTLTHNDLTGCLTLSIGSEYNRDQLSGWYTKIVRDEVLAEWIILTCSETSHPRGELHVYCHVSGEELWPAPAPLRSFIFQREMKLVLDTILYADREMLSSNPWCQSACVYVHLASNLEPLNQKIAWGQLGDKSTWRMGPKGSLLDILFSSSSYSSDDDDDDLEGMMGGSAEDAWPVPRSSITNKVVLEGVPSIIPAKLDSVSSSSMNECVAGTRCDSLD